MGETTNGMDLTREALIKGLQICTDPRVEGCDGCPLKSDGVTCQIKLMRQAAEQLRKDALLLTVDDVPHWDGAVWLEFKVISGANGQGGTWAFFVAEQRPNFNFQLQRELQQLTRLPIDTYGYYWRCWSKRPTDEQREAAEWF